MSGFNVEYGGANFAFIFMSEYINILIVCAFTRAIFISAFGNMFLGQVGLVLSTFLLAALFVGIRATLPRMRYDQLIMLT